MDSTHYRFLHGIIPVVVVERSERDKRRARRLGWLGYTLARGLGRTVRLYVAGWEPIERHLQEGTGAVMVSWHGRTLIPANLCVVGASWR
jgi:hypothetical protein